VSRNCQPVVVLRSTNESALTAAAGWWWKHAEGPTNLPTQLITVHQWLGTTAQVFREGFVRDYALELRHRDGHITSVLYNASVYRDENGNVIGIFAAARDITERKHRRGRIAAKRAAL
jgi:PAS domain-containing protein